MADWIIETDRNCFSASSLEEVINDTINFYYENDKNVENIDSISCEENGEIYQQLPQSEIRQIQNRIEEEVNEWKKEAEEYREELRLLRRDYHASLI